MPVRRVRIGNCRKEIIGTEKHRIILQKQACIPVVCRSKASDRRVRGEVHSTAGLEYRSISS